MTSIYPSGFTNEVWYCGRDLHYERRFPQHLEPCNECPFCCVPFDPKLRSSIGKPPGAVAIVTFCTNHIKGPAMECSRPEESCRPRHPVLAAAPWDFAHVCVMKPGFELPQNESS